MKKLLSTIGLGIALMTGFAPSQADATITFESTNTGPDKWTYNLVIDKDIVYEGNSILLTTTGKIDDVGLDPGPFAGWFSTELPDEHNAIWISNQKIVALDKIIIENFFVTSKDPSGPALWSYSGRPTTETSGPVPEPATVMLLGIGGLLAGGRKLYESKKEEAAL